MRLALRFVLAAFAVLIFLLLVLKNHLEDIWDQYSVGDYIEHKVKGKDGYKGYLPPLLGAKGDKIIVMARLETDNTDWVTHDLAEYVLNHITLPTLSLTQS